MLRYQADRRTLGFVLTYFLLVAGLWVWDPGQWYIAVPAVLIVASLSWMCAVITHNTIHCAIFENRKLNKAFQVVLTLTYGHPVSSYVSGHNLSHHMYTQQDRDVMRTTKVAYRWHFLNLVMFVPKVGGAVTKGDFAFAKLMRQQRPRWFKAPINVPVEIVRNRPMTPSASRRSASCSASPSGVSGIPPREKLWSRMAPATRSVDAASKPNDGS